MKRMTLKLTVEELSLLATLAADQLFRREFIDRRIPGYNVNPGEMHLGKALVARLRLLAAQGSREGLPPPAGATASLWTSPTKRQTGIPHAH
jgi:hypothetical protein